MTNTPRLEQTKKTNQQFVLNLLRSNNFLSRTILVEKTGLSKATISRILSEMIKDGLVEEIQTTASGVGRPQIMLRLVSGTRYAIGVELSSSALRTILTDLNLRLIKQRFLPLHNANTDVFVQSMSDEIESFCQGISDRQLVGIGLAIPGIVNSETGVATIESSTGWQEIPFTNQLSGKVGKPIYLLNRTQAATWGENWFRESKQVSDLLFIRLGTFVESGIIIDGNLINKSMLSPGAIGHMTLDPKGIRCTCGNLGCLNTVLGTQAILDTTRNLLKDDKTSILMGMVDGNPSFLNLDHLLSAVEAGDGLAVKIFANAGKALGVIVANLVNLLHFERVVIGGQLSAAGMALLTPLQEEVSIRALPASLVSCQIGITNLGETAAAIGAASLLLQNLSK